MVTFSQPKIFCNEKGILDFPWKVVSAILLLGFGKLCVPDFGCNGSNALAANGSSLPVSRPAACHTENQPEVSAACSAQTRIDEINNAITRLGDPSYLVRNEAEAELLKIGGPAIEPLTSVLMHRDSRTPDNEIMLRASRLLILIKRAEHTRRIAEFLNGSDIDCKLAGWNEFSKIVGSDKIARKLFVAMHEAQPQLMSSIANGLDATEASFQDIVKQSLRSGSNSAASEAFGTLAAVLFTSSLTFESDSGQPATFQFSDFDLRKIQTVLNQTQMVARVESSPSKTPIKQLISHWIDAITDDQVQWANMKMSVIAQYRLKNKLDVVMAVLSRKTFPAQTRATAIEVVSQLGNEQLIPKLESLFSDDSEVGSYLARQTLNAPSKTNAIRAASNLRLINVKLCDLALATAIILGREDLRDFGFPPGAMVGNKLVLDQAGFLSERDRQFAFEKWKSTKRQTSN